MTTIAPTAIRRCDSLSLVARRTATAPSTPIPANRPMTTSSRITRSGKLTGIAELDSCATAGTMKLYLARGRPDVVPHLAIVTSPSFPSGHATFAAVIYLTLGAPARQGYWATSNASLSGRSRTLTDIPRGRQPSVPWGSLSNGRSRGMVRRAGLGTQLLARSTLSPVSREPSNPDYPARRRALPDHARLMRQSSRCQGDFFM